MSVEYQGSGKTGAENRLAGLGVFLSGLAFWLFTCGLAFVLFYFAGIKGYFVTITDIVENGASIHTLLWTLLSVMLFFCILSLGGNFFRKDSLLISYPRKIEDGDLWILFAAVFGAIGISILLGLYFHGSLSPYNSQTVSVMLSIACALAAGIGWACAVFFVENLLSKLTVGEAKIVKCAWMIIFVPLFLTATHIGIGCATIKNIERDAAILNSSTLSVNTLGNILEITLVPQDRDYFFRTFGLRSGIRIQEYARVGNKSQPDKIYLEGNSLRSMLGINEITFVSSNGLEKTFPITKR